MKKKISWDERITVIRLLERYNFDPNFLEMMGKIIKKIDGAVKNCQ